MKRLVRYDLLQEGERLIRVLWCEPEGTRVVVLETTRPDGWPEFRDLGEILDDLRTKALTYAEDNFILDCRLDSVLKPQHVRHRDAAWQLIRPLVEDEPAIYDKATRCSYLDAVVRDNDISRRGVTRYLQQYWRNGMTKNALLPRYSACGAPGVRRADTAVRRGRPRGAGLPPGLNTTAEHKQYFSLAIRRFYAKNRKLDLTDAYIECIRLFFSNEIVDEKGYITHESKPEFEGVGFPSFGQFKYWARFERFASEVQRKRETPRIYEMKHRGLTGSTTREAWGPGSRYQIDATIADIYLVSSCDTNQLIGRPVVYVIIDAFSRLIVGLYVGLEGPSYVAAMMALVNAATPKKAYCAQFGIDIEEEDWPVYHLPSVLLADRGELIGTGIDNALETFGVLVENAPPYRGDWKGLVESQFRTLHKGFKAYTKGYVECDFRQRGARDYRADAVLNLEDFTKIIIDMILVYNRSHVLENYERHTGMTEDGVHSIPLELWRWGIANISGPPKARPPEQVRFVLMPKDEATVTPHGISYNNVLYTCATASRENWFGRARTKRFPVEISYDKRDASRIYVHTPKVGFGFEIANLAPKSAQYDKLSGWEIAALQVKDDLLHRNHEQTELLEKAARVSRMEKTVRDATSRAEENRSSDSDAKRVRDIRSNRADEKSKRRVQEAAASRPDAERTKAEPGIVVPFPKSEAPPKKLFARPGASLLKKRIEKDDD